MQLRIVNLATVAPTSGSQQRMCHKNKNATKATTAVLDTDAQLLCKKCLSLSHELCMMGHVITLTVLQNEWVPFAEQSSSKKVWFQRLWVCASTLLPPLASSSTTSRNNSNRMRGIPCKVSIASHHPKTRQMKIGWLGCFVHA